MENYFIFNVLIRTRLLLVLFIVGFSASLNAAVAPSKIAIVVNDNDPMSVEVGEYYQRKRELPAENVIHVSLPVVKSMSDKKFSRIRQLIFQQTPEHVQFYVLAWTMPFKVKCMSISSAMTFGFDEKYCAKGCKRTKASEYYNSDIREPYTKLGIRPTMLLAGRSAGQVKALIDRGIAADNSFPLGTGYLVSTKDRNRNVRAKGYKRIMATLSERIKLEYVETNTLQDKQDVLFYFTGLKSVRKLKSNTYLPGAIADHLTSAGGNLAAANSTSSSQMSALKWLDAGATASYGTVVEPCNFLQKFPNPGIVIDRYTRGESIIEAYWKSVAWPGQGVFVGEPLAAPFASKMKQ